MLQEKHKPNESSNFWGKLWRNGSAWTSWNPTQQLHRNTLFISGFFINHAMLVVQSVEAPSFGWKTKGNQLPLGCDSLYFWKEVAGLTHAPAVLRLCLCQIWPSTKQVASAFKVQRHSRGWAVHAQCHAWLCPGSSWLFPTGKSNLALLV